MPKYVWLVISRCTVNDGSYFVENVFLDEQKAKDKLSILKTQQTMMNMAFTTKDRNRLMIIKKQIEDGKEE